MGIVNGFFIVLGVGSVVYMIISLIILMGDITNGTAYTNSKISLVETIAALLLWIVFIVVIDGVSQNDNPALKMTELEPVTEHHLLSLGDAAYALEDDLCYYFFISSDKNPRQHAKKDTVIKYDTKEPYVEIKSYKKILYAKKVPLISSAIKTQYILHLTCEDDIQKITPKISRE